MLVLRSLREHIHFTDNYLEVFYEVMTAFEAKGIHFFSKSIWKLEHFDNKKQ